MGAKIVLSVITAFLLILAVYLLVTNKKVSGAYYSDTGWLQGSFSGYVLLFVAIGFLVATILVFKRNRR